MPKLNQASTYGTQQINNSLTFRERLMERFQAHEYVRVINIDNVPITWQYLPSHAEEISYTSDPMKITHRGPVEVYMLNPGESEVLIGECAYLMMENLYKQIIAKKTIERTPEVDPGQARNFNFSDAQRQEEYIDRILLGKESPQFSNYEPVKEPQETDNEKPERKPRSTVERQLKQHLQEQVA